MEKVIGPVEALVTRMNNIDTNIKFTMEKGSVVPFLDVSFSLNSDKTLSTDIYYKSTDSHNFVNFFSFHPNKTLINVPYTLARRIVTICSDKDKRDFCLDELKGFLLQKKYPLEVINDAIKKASFLDRESLLSAIVQVKKSTIPFVHTHNDKNPNVTHAIIGGLEMMAPSQRMSSILNSNKVVAARRQPPNMRNMLFHSRYEGTNTKPQNGIFPCTPPDGPPRPGRKCICCDMLETGDTFNFAHHDKPFNILYPFTCETRGVVYVLICDGCGEMYVGKTDRSVRDRAGEHRRAISSGRYTLAVHKHINQCGAGVFSMAPFYKICPMERGFDLTLTWEDNFIKKFTPSPNRLRLN